MSSTFEVVIIKWNKNNPKHRSGMKGFMFKNGFFSDPKVAQLTPIDVALFVYLMCVRSESTTDQLHITVNTIPKQFRMGYKSLTNGLERLQSLQLVSYSKVPLNIIELNRIKDNRIKSPTGVAEAQPRPPKKVLDEDSKKLNSECWESYKTAYVKVWQKEPVRNATTNSQISSLAKRLGSDAPKVLDFYVRHKDSFYVKNCHPIGLCLKNAEGLHTQWKRGFEITNAKMRQYENNQHYTEQLDRIEKGEV